MYICSTSSMESKLSSGFHCTNRYFDLSDLFKGTSQSLIRSILEVFGSPNYILCVTLYLKLDFLVTIGQILRFFCFGLVFLGSLI